MVWSQYKNETAMTNSHHNDENDYDDNLPENIELEYEDWKTWHATDLFNMWHSLQCYVQDTCIQLDVLNFSDYDDFCTYVYEHSTKIKTKNAS